MCVSPSLLKNLSENRHRYEVSHNVFPPKATVLLLSFHKAQITPTIS